MSGIIDYDTFLDFYSNNKEKLFMTNSGSKHINNANVQKWFNNIQTQSPEDIKDTYEFFAKTFIEFLRYVPFDEFYQIIEKISLEILHKIIESDYTNIYFYIPDEVNKSNLWVTLLFLDCLLKSKLFTEDIKNKIKYVNNYNTLVVHSNNNKTLCLYCDDMSYTGSQICANFIRQKHRIKDIQPDTHIDKYFIISYISNIAKDKVTNSLENVHFCENTVGVDRYIDQLKKQYGDTNEENVKNVLRMFSYNPDDIISTMGRNACNCSKGYTPIYFDHKIADALSTFDKLLFTGAYPISKTSTVCEINPLIEGCDDIVNLASLFSENPCKINQSLDSDVPCFPSFYKTISYTINDTVLKNKNIIFFLENLSTHKGGFLHKRRIKQKKTIKKHKYSKKNKSHKYTN